MPLSTYRTPRYLIDHVFRDSRVIISGDAADPPLSRLVDEQNERVSEISQKTATNIKFNRGANSGARQFGEPIDRIIIAGHNAAADENNSLVEVYYSEDDISYTRHTLIDGSQIGFNAPTGPVDFQINQPVVTAGFGGPRYERTAFGVSAGTGGTENHQVGEIFAGRVLTTSSGIVSDWTDEELPNATVAETFAHRVFTLERGSARRVWRLRYQAIDDADMQTLDSIRRTVGIQVHPFWFDPPASGAVQNVDDLWDPTDTGNWTAGVDTTLTFPAADSPNAGPTVKCTSTAQTFSGMIYDLPVPVDLHGKILQFDLRQFPTAWVDAESQVRLRLTETITLAGRNEYYLGDALMNLVAPADVAWHRYQVDPHVQIANVNTHGDAEKIDRITILQDISAQTIGDGLEVANLTIVDKAESVKFVELLAFEKSQASAVPQAGLAWDVDLTVREVLS